MKTFLSGFAPAMALSLPLGLGAQPAPDAAPLAPPRPLAHASAFDDYRPWADTPRGDWRRLNDDLLRPAAEAAAPAAHGGHGGGHGDGKVPATPPAGHAMPMPHPHAGHAPAGARP